MKQRRPQQHRMTEQSRLNAQARRRLTGRKFEAASVAMATAVVFALSGCGAWQATRDGTVDAAQWVFTTQVKTMNIDLDARAALNETTGGQALSTVVRLYQLKDAKTFAQLEYVQLQNHDLELLKADLVATKDVVMRPGSSASVSEPMDKDAEYVGVVAFFRSPSNDGVWKLLIPKKQWKDTDPVKIHVQGNLLAYEGAKPKPVTRDTPQQSTSAQKAPPGMSAGGAASAQSTNGKPVTLINPDAALGNSADSAWATRATVPTSAPQVAPGSAGSVFTNVPKASTAGKAAAKNADAAADALTNAKSSAKALSRGAAGLLSR